LSRRTYFAALFCPVALVYLAAGAARAETAAMKIKSALSEKPPPPADDFFVPELCQPETLLSMVLLAELLVLVLVLSEPMRPGFDWVRLALTSLFVQWIVLLSAAVLCRLRPLMARMPAATAGTLCCAIVVALSLLCTAVADYYELGGPLQRTGEVNLYLRATP
jgi:two-component system sensor histidine kinase AlgZ